MANFFRLFFILFLLMIAGPVFLANGNVYATGGGSFEVPEVSDDFSKVPQGPGPGETKGLKQSPQQESGFWDQVLQFVSDIWKKATEIVIESMPYIAGGAGLIAIAALAGKGIPTLLNLVRSKYKINNLSLINSSPALAEKIAADPQLLKAYQEAEKEIRAYEKKYAGFIDPVFAQEIMYKKLKETGKLNESEMKTILDAIYAEKQTVFVSRLKELEQEIKKYKGDDLSREEIDEYICDFMRYPNYTGSKWALLAGTVDEDFIEEFKRNNPSLYNYFCYAKNVDPKDPAKKATLTDLTGKPIYEMNPVTQNVVKKRENNELIPLERSVNSYDLQHMFATYSGGRYGDGGLVDFFAEGEIRELVGWAADLQSISKIYEGYEIESKHLVNFNEFGQFNQHTVYDASFSQQDYEADLDAHNLNHYGKKHIIDDYHNYFVENKDYQKRTTLFVESYADPNAADKIKSGLEKLDKKSDYYMNIHTHIMPGKTMSNRLTNNPSIGQGFPQITYQLLNDDISYESAKTIKDEFMKKLERELKYEKNH
ncbi:hypothetical protein [Thermoactinomyces mirandus]|nr:hypothetical protein [Thermoactinomyces mirandus]